MLKIILLLFCTLISQGPVEAADKIRIAYSAGTYSLLFLIAHSQGFLNVEGLDVEIIRMTGEGMLKPEGL